MRAPQLQGSNIAQGPPQKARPAGQAVGSLLADESDIADPSGPGEPQGAAWSDDDDELEVFSDDRAGSTPANALSPQPFATKDTPSESSPSTGAKDAFALTPEAQAAIDKISGAARGTTRPVANESRQHAPQALACGKEVHGDDDNQSEADDEFGYALDGQERDEGFFRKEYKPEALPAHLVTNVATTLTALDENVIQEEDSLSDYTSTLNGQDHRPDGADASDEGGAEIQERCQHGPAGPQAAISIDASTAGTPQGAAKASLPDRVQRLMAEAAQPSSGANDALRAAAAAGADRDLTFIQPRRGGATTAAKRHDRYDAPAAAGEQPSASAAEQVEVDVADELAFANDVSGTRNREAAAAAADTSASPKVQSAGFDDLSLPDDAAEGEARAASSAAASDVADLFTDLGSARPTSEIEAAPAQTSSRRKTGGKASSRHPGTYAVVGPSSAPRQSRDARESIGRASATMSAPCASTSLPQAVSIGLDPMQSQKCQELLQLFFTCPCQLERDDLMDLDLQAPSGFFSKMVWYMRRPPKLPRNIENQRRRLLWLSRTPMNRADEAHAQAAASVYSLCTSEKCPQQFGSHWERLGFQGQDPATDLRGSGMLALVCLLMLFQHNVVNANAIFRLSTRGFREFPFALVSINITKWAVDAMCHGKLNALAIKHGSMVQVLKSFYVGAFYRFYLIWLKNDYTMMQIGTVLRDLEKSAVKQVSKTIATAQQEMPTSASMS